MWSRTRCARPRSKRLECRERVTRVSETETPGRTADSGSDMGLQHLADLVEEWLDWQQAGERLQVSVSKVRQLIREHQLAAVVPVPKGGQQVPAALIQDGLVVKGVPGVLTVLH